MSMIWCRRNINPLLRHWSYVSFALGTKPSFWWFLNPSNAWHVQIRYPDIENGVSKNLLRVGARPPAGCKGLHIFNTLRPRQNGRHFADDTFKCIFLNENVEISIKISLKFVPKGPINNIPSLVQVMAWRRPGDKPLTEPMVVKSLTHICVTRPQWVKRIMAVEDFKYIFVDLKSRASHHCNNCNDVIMGAVASQITSVSVIYSTVYSGGDQRKHQSSALLAFVRGIHRWPVNSPHKGPVTRKTFPFDDVVMIGWWLPSRYLTSLSSKSLWFLSRLLCMEWCETRMCNTPG